MAELNDSDFENLGGSPERILVSPGIYPARFIRKWSDRRRKDWGEKLIFEWEVYLNTAITQSVRLCRFYNVNRDKGGRFVFGDGHDYRKDWIRANDGKHPVVWRQLPSSVSVTRKFLVEVMTITRDSKGHLHRSLYWSKVGAIIRPVNDGEIFLVLPIQPSDLTDETE